MVNHKIWRNEDDNDVVVYWSLREKHGKVSLCAVRDDGSILPGGVVCSISDEGFVLEYGVSDKLGLEVEETILGNYVRTRPFVDIDNDY